MCVCVKGREEKRRREKKKEGEEGERRGKGGTNNLDPLLTNPSSLLWTPDLLESPEYKQLAQLVEQALRTFESQRDLAKPTLQKLFRGLTAEFANPDRNHKLWQLDAEVLEKLLIFAQQNLRPGLKVTLVRVSTERESVCVCACVCACVCVRVCARVLVLCVLCVLRHEAVCF